MKNKNESITTTYLLTYIVIFVTWVPGVVLAKGFVSTLFSLMGPFWAWYLWAEKIMQMLGIIS